MRNFKSGNWQRGGGDSFRGDFGGRDSRRPVLYDAVCSECGKNCQVPFRPSREKPVYCSDCFEKRGGRDNDRSSQRPFRRQSFGGSGDREQSSILNLEEKIKTLNVKLDTIINLLSPGGIKKSKPIKIKSKKNQKSKKSKTKK